MLPVLLFPRSVGVLALLFRRQLHNVVKTLLKCVSRLAIYQGPVNFPWDFSCCLDLGNLGT